MKWRRKGGGGDGDNNKLVNSEKLDEIGAAINREELGKLVLVLYIVILSAVCVSTCLQIRWLITFIFLFLFIKII